jgi:hypothetical protein
MTALRYPVRALAGDYLRGALGLAVAGAMWLALPAATHIHVIFGGLTLLFALFTIRTAWRHGLRFELAPDGLVQVWPQRRVLLWDRLDSLRLRYYSTRRNREGGWMTLTMRAGDVRCAVDSSLDGFERIAARAAESADRRGIAVDSATRANLEALALDRQAPAIRRADAPLDAGGDPGADGSGLP